MWPRKKGGIGWFLEADRCTDDDCDCRRVIIRVLSENSPGKVWATISYGWEDAAFYRQWSSGTRNAREWFGPTLDPPNPQSAHAGAFLSLFKNVVLQDKSFFDTCRAVVLVPSQRSAGSLGCRRYCSAMASARPTCPVRRHKSASRAQ
jgi:hypothetical protein